MNAPPPLLVKMNITVVVIHVISGVKAGPEPENNHSKVEVKGIAGLTKQQQQLQHQMYYSPPLKESHITNQLNHTHPDIVHTHNSLEQSYVILHFLTGALGPITLEADHKSVWSQLTQTRELAQVNKNTKTSTTTTTIMNMMRREWLTCSRFWQPSLSVRATTMLWNPFSCK